MSYLQSERKPNQSAFNQHPDTFNMQFGRLDWSLALFEGCIQNHLLDHDIYHKLILFAVKPCSWLLPKSNITFSCVVFNEQRSLDCALFCCKALRKRLELLLECSSRFQKSNVKPGIKVQKPSKIIFCNSLQTEIVRHVEFNSFA